MTHKIPGWGLLRPLETRTGPKGQQFLVCPPGHEACIWAGLQEVAHHQGRIIYTPTT